MDNLTESVLVSPQAATPAIIKSAEGMVDQPGNSRNSGTTRSRRNSANNNDGTLLWVTSNDLDGFKDKDVMREVRKAAMHDHLRKKPKHPARPTGNRAHVQRPGDRFHSVGSGISDDQEPSLTSNEWALRAIYGGRSRRPSSRSDLTQSTTYVLGDEDPPDGTKEEPTEGLRVDNARKASVEREEPVSGRIRAEELPNEEGLPSKEDMDVSSDSEGPEEANNERFAALVAQGRNFIEESNAFKKLRKDFRKFVMPPPKQILQPEPTVASETCYEVSPGPVPGLPLGLALKIYRNVLVLLSSIGLRENDIPPGHQRIRWINVSVFIAISS